MRSLRTRAGAALAVIVLVGAGCGDTDGDSVEQAAQDSSAETASTEEAATQEISSGAATPVSGLLVSVLSSSFGLFALDEQTGEATGLSVTDAGFADRSRPAVLSQDGSTAYVMVYTPVEDQSFTNEVALASVDLATGTGEKLVELGRDREDDESSELTDRWIVGVGSATVWVEERPFFGDFNTLIGYERFTGAESLRVDSAADDPLRSLVVVGDDVYAQIANSLSVLDPDSGVWTAVFDFNEVDLATILTPADLTDFAITRSGGPVDAEWADFILSFTEPRPSGAAWAAGGGSLWWLFSSVNSREDDVAVVSGLVEFDVQAGAIVDAWPIPTQTDIFVEENTVNSFTQATYAYVGGELWLADIRDNGKLYRLDAETGLTGFEIPIPDGIDYTRIELLTSDPEGLWLDVTDWVITSTEDDGQSSTGTSSFQRYDAQAGTPVFTVAKTDLIGS